MYASVISALPVLMLAKYAAAAGCATHTYGTCEDNIVHWYDPDTYEICDPLDCGGGRAPVKYSVPGCAAYTGTEEYKPTVAYMTCFLSKTTAAATTLSTSAPSKTTTSAAKDETSTTSAAGSSKTSAQSTSAQSTSTAQKSATVPLGTGAITSAPTVAPTRAPAAGNGTATTVPHSPSGANTIGGSLMAAVGVAVAAFALL